MRYYLFSFLFLLFSLPVSALERKIGFPEFSTEENLIDGDSALSFVLRSATTAGLTRAKGTDGFELLLADSYQAYPEHGYISFRLTDRISFSNGQPIRPRDVSFSLRRCFGSSLKVRTRQGQDSERWVDISLGAGTSLPLAELTRVLSKCPIYEENTTDVFADAFGEGTNVVSAGPYVTRFIRRGKHLRLGRIYNVGENEVVPQTIELQSVADPTQGLAALRSGQLDLFFTENQGVMERVRKDETLLASKCSIYSVVYRKGIRVRCEPDLRVMELAYDFERKK